MDLQLFNTHEAGAIFSPCRKYRYVLWREWDKTKPMVAFIGLNPSTANEVKNDPTIRKVTKFARTWGYGGVYMLNLFAYISPYPEDLKTCEDPLGENDRWLDAYLAKSDKIIFSWGRFDVFGRDKEIMERYPNAYCLIKNNNDTPRHPLYVPDNTEPILFNAAT